MDIPQDISRYCRQLVKSYQRFKKFHGSNIRSQPQARYLSNDWLLVRKDNQYKGLKESFWVVNISTNEEKNLTLKELEFFEASLVGGVK